jgi:hypothetical protein
MTPKLRAGHIVRVRVIKPAPTYVLVQPVSLLDESELPPESEFEAAPVGSDLNKYIVESPTMPETTVSPISKRNSGRVDQFVETVTVTNYKCKLCYNVYPLRKTLERHIAEDHNVQYD